MSKNIFINLLILLILFLFVTCKTVYVNPDYNSFEKVYALDTVKQNLKLNTDKLTFYLLGYSDTGIVRIFDSKKRKLYDKILTTDDRSSLMDIIEIDHKHLNNYLDFLIDKTLYRFYIDNRLYYKYVVLKKENGKFKTYLLNTKPRIM